MYKIRKEIELKVGICDDNETDLQAMYQISRNTISAIGMECEIKTFGSGVELLQEIHEMDLLILDIEMPGITGIEIKEELQWEDQEHLIIFVSDHEERMNVAYGIHVLSFIPKKDMEDQLPEFIEKAMHMRERYVNLDGKLDSRMIKYIKSARSYCDLYLKGGEMQDTRVSMKQYEKILTKVDFLRVHRSYLVNLRYVDKITETHVYIGEDKLPVATRFSKKVHQKYRDYLVKNARY